MSAQTQSRFRYKKLRGFTFVEIVIVIAIIAILAAVAVSSALRARIKGNEGSAQSSLKSIQAGALTFRTDNGAYPTDLATLGSSYLGGNLASGAHSGYDFTLSQGNSGQTYTASGTPQSAGFTGVRSFCTDVSNVIYIYDGGANPAGDGVTCPPGGSAMQS